MLIDALFFSIILGYLRGGSLSRLSRLNIKYPWLIFLAFLINFLLLPFLFKEKLLSANSIFFGLVFSYLFLLVAVWFNRKDKYLLILGAGIALNFLVILLNRGMPVSLFMVEKFSPQDYEYIRNMEGFLHIPMTDSTQLKFLGDILP
ncbi:MAG: DUF5317 family protein, partial [Candidatus Subteraquimicrobiales bacterium]|nr:DUF5317 family protein [Candidatus Subteraquimicrobiales bacterium]